MMMCQLSKLLVGVQRYYHNRWQPVSGPAGPYYVWHYLDDNPSSVEKNHDLDDTEHASLEMRYLGLLWRNKDRLNALLSGVDQIDLTYSDMGMIAKTFLTVATRDSLDANHVVRPHLAADLTRALAKPVDYRDVECNGWINLAEFDRGVYSRCEGVTLKPPDPDPSLRHNDDTAYSPAQPYLHVGIHAALLALKQFRP